MYDVVNFILFNSINKSISYILYNNDIIVNLYKLHFSFFPFSFQPNKRFFHPPTFPPFNQTHKRESQIFSILSLFHFPIIFHSSTFLLLQSIKPFIFCYFSFVSLIDSCITTDKYVGKSRPLHPCGTIILTTCSISLKSQNISLITVFIYLFIFSVAKRNFV